MDGQYPWVSLAMMESLSFWVVVRLIHVTPTVEVKFNTYCGTKLHNWIA